MIELVPSQLAIRDTVREFVLREVVLEARERDRLVDPLEAYPWALVERLSQLGVRTHAVPKELGGGGADFTTQLLVSEELAYGDLGLAESFATTVSWSHILSTLANDEQRARLLPAFLADDRFMLAHAMSEPTAGSDNMLPNEDPGAGVATSAHLDGAEWVISGTKSFTSNGNLAKIVFVMARTNPHAPVIDGCTLFAIPQGTPGFTVSHVEDKLGQRLGNNAELLFESCRVPDIDRIGEVDAGMRLLGRISYTNVVKTGANALGVARAAYDASVAYARERVQGSRPIIEHQAIGMMLADMRMRIEAGRSFVYSVGATIDREGGCDPDLPRLAKVFACEVASDVTLRAIEIFGGYGIIKNFPVEKYHRDALTLLHSGGTQQVLLIKVARGLMTGSTVGGW